MTVRKNIGPCIEDGCDSEQVTRNLCSMHYARLKLTGVTDGSVKMPRSKNRSNPDGTARICSVVECIRKARSRGICDPHLSEMREVDPVEFSRMDICPVPSCGREKLKAKPWCSRCKQFAWRFSLTLDDVINLHASERRICSNPGCDSGATLHLDHDHACCPPGSFPASHKVSCGECVRGWLCAPCNKALGMLQENPRRIQGLLDFLNGVRK